MPRIDDYRQARELARKELSEREPGLIARFSGASIRTNDRGSTSIVLNLLNKNLVISWPDMKFSYEESEGEVPIQQQVLVLHYLRGAVFSGGATITGEWISFQDVPDGRFYMDAFVKRAKDPLIDAFGDNPSRMMDLASKLYDAVTLDYGDVSVIIKVLPHVPVALVLWEGDDEFSPDGNLLFDKSICGILSAEDIAWLAGMVVYPLAGMVRK
jgi:hypothetical protein